MVPRSAILECADAIRNGGKGIYKIGTIHILIIFECNGIKLVKTPENGH